MIKKLIYLASPYFNRKPKSEGETDDDYESRCKLIHELRYQKAIDATAKLMSKGLAVYSPIVATHPVAVKHELPLGSEYWMQFDEVMLSRCNELCVLMIDGWKESPGVQREIDIAKKIGVEITYIE